MDKDKKQLAKYIDHTNLKPNAQKQDIETLCKEAKQYGFASVCVHPYYIPLTKQLLADSEVKVCTVIGFPLGANSSETKLTETKLAIQEGAQEIDMVINISALTEGLYEYVRNEIEQIKNMCGDKILKVIIETSYLTDEQKAKENWKEENNPYATLPRMVLLTYQMPDSIREIALGGEYNEFDLNVFFAAKGEKTNAKFTLESDVQKWLDLIRGGPYVSG